jgi:hypothetical protein
MINNAHVCSERSCGDGFAIARVAQDVAALTLVNVALEVYAHDIAALRHVERRVMHLYAHDLGRSPHLLKTWRDSSFL